MIEFSGGWEYFNQYGDRGTYNISEYENTIHVIMDYGYEETFSNCFVKGETFEWDMDMKEDAQTEINNKYPNEHIIIYDLVIRVKAIRK